MTGASSCAARHRRSEKPLERWPLSFDRAPTFCGPSARWRRATLARDAGGIRVGRLHVPAQETITGSCRAKATAEPMVRTAYTRLGPRRRILSGIVSRILCRFALPRASYVTEPSRLRLAVSTPGGGLCGRTSARHQRLCTLQLGAHNEPRIRAMKHAESKELGNSLVLNPVTTATARQ